MNGKFSAFRWGLGCSAALALLCVGAAHTQPRYQIAFTSQAPRNSQLFLADGDGRNATPLVPHASFDANASFSPDGQWVVGREMFYLDRLHRLTAVSVHERDSRLTVGPPKTLLASAYFADAGPAPGRPYDLSPDGRFLMIKEGATNDARTTPASITVVLNWLEELKRLVPAK